MKKKTELWDPRKKSELRDVNSELQESEFWDLYCTVKMGKLLQEMQWFRHWFCFE